MLYRAPGSSRENFSALVVSLVSKKPLRKVCSATGACPWPPKMIVLSNPNSKFVVGRKENISECTHGEFGAVCPFKLPMKKSYRTGPMTLETQGIFSGSTRLTRNE